MASGDGRFGTRLFMLRIHAVRQIHCTCWLCPLVFPGASRSREVGICLGPIEDRGGCGGAGHPGSRLSGTSLHQRPDIAQNIYAAATQPVDVTGPSPATDRRAAQIQARAATNDLGV
jgi:hypothetical protein